MAFTPAQEAYLATIANEALALEAYRLKVAEVDAARFAIHDQIYAKYAVVIETSTGAPQKLAIKQLQAEIAADPEVAKLEAEAAALLAQVKP
jgi:hypothetical protein